MEYLQLFNWYDTYHRDLPFRKTKDPYQIWVSEIMLQQTQVDTMLPYYEKFLKTFPNCFVLASKDLDEVLKVVQGIGYYKRFRMLLEGAKYVVDTYQGNLPPDYEKLLKIPGIGAYTAGAIMSIAFDKPYPATDGNVIRVLSRVYQYSDDFRIEKNKKKLNEINKKLIKNSGNPYKYTQSVMELGATVCKPQNPKCNECPLSNMCLSNQSGTQLNYPVMSKLKEKKEVVYTVLILKYKDGYLLRKRDDALLHGFYEFVQIETDSIHYAQNTLENEGVTVSITDELKPIKHVFTHMVWHVKPYLGYVDQMIEGYELVTDFSLITRSSVLEKILKVML